MEHIERMENPGLTTQLKHRVNTFLEDWALDSEDPETLELDYGTLLLEGTEAVGDLDRQIPLEKEVSLEKFEQTSPSDLKRELRQEVTYQTTYDDLVDDIKAYLEREGLDPDEFEFGSPFQIQAQAEAIDEDHDEDGNKIETEDVFGTKFTIDVKNRRDIGRERNADRLRMGGTVTVRVDMPPIIGREVIADMGEYDQEAEVYEFHLGEVVQGSEESVSFIVPVTAGSDLEELSGEFEVKMRTPFTYLAPSGVFDPGGERIRLRAFRHDDRRDVRSQLRDSDRRNSEAGYRVDPEESVRGGHHPTRRRGTRRERLRRRGISAEY